MRYDFCPHCMTELVGSQTYCPRCGRETDYDPHVKDLPPGTELRPDNGKIYRIGKKLGAGGFGITYIAKELRMGCTVAIKEYFPTGMLNPSGRIGLCPNVDDRYTEAYERSMKNFEKEASMLAALNHIPHIVHVLDYFFANNTAYMVMEYLDGTTIKDYMVNQERFEPISLLRKMLPLMRDIQELHESSVLHRDIAPDNIMIMPDGTLKLLDFGSARSTAVDEHTVIIKPGFTPIEQYQRKGQGGFTDVYSTAASIYYCITGLTPTPAPDRLMEIMVKGHPDPIVPPSQYSIAISADIEQLLMWCLELQPDSRLQTMKEFADKLEEALRKLPDDTENNNDCTKTPLSERLRNILRNIPKRKKIIAAAVIGAAAVILLIILLILLH